MLVPIVFSDSLSALMRGSNKCVVSSKAGRLGEPFSTVVRRLSAVGDIMHASPCSSFSVIIVSELPCPREPPNARRMGKMISACTALQTIVMRKSLKKYTWNGGKFKKIQIASRTLIISRWAPERSIVEPVIVTTGPERIMGQMLPTDDSARSLARCWGEQA